MKALEIVNGLVDSSEEEQIEAWQILIDTGEAWRQPGSIGRAAMQMIEWGVCTAPERRAA